MRFDILDPEGENIEDPETGEILGSLKRVKVRVEVIKVQEKLSVASTYKKKRINIGGQSFNISEAFSKPLMPAEWIVKHETLKTKEKTWNLISLLTLNIKLMCFYKLYFTYA